MIKAIETSEKNQYRTACYHPDSSLKVELYISKITEKFTHSENPKSE